MLEKEIKKVNRAIDEKILRGEEYRKEARDHRLMLRRLRFMQKQNPFKKAAWKFFPTIASICL